MEAGASGRTKGRGTTLSLAGPAKQGWLAALSPKAARIRAGLFIRRLAAN
jgi:hypothetical protein